MPFDEKELLGRQLINLCRLHGKRIDQAMERFGLFRGQAILLVILSHKDGLTHSEIAEKLEISPAAATKVIKRLEQQHYVKRQADQNDERVSRVFLQPAGAELTEQIHQTFSFVDHNMFTDFSPEDLTKFNQLLLRASQNLQGGEALIRNPSEDETVNQ